MPSLDELRQLAQQIGVRFHADAVVLFGSTATGGADQGSDVDLLVIGRFSESPYRLCGDIRASIQTTYPVDIVVRRSDEVRQRLEGGDPILQEAMEHGIVLYGAAA